MQPQTRVGAIERRARLAATREHAHAVCGGSRMRRKPDADREPAAEWPNADAGRIAATTTRAAVNRSVPQPRIDVARTACPLPVQLRRLAHRRTPTHRVNG
ncbi:hypothetical protein KDX01_30535 [Burkholderia vietnamiensis]|uniref:hypothetical protein n=1 Tax=Burkholderia vietnamiensis TaxID=60552 RepID=UPI001B93F5EA|nr:hypothetical protein [Burkholderia vietnamiensis]MBR7977434.1 hypothetical protein [Burkholderia vietnamiensis]